MVRNWIGFFAVLCGSVVVLTAGCANEDFSSCEANESCPGVGGSDGGVGGTAGTSGTSGTGGTGATGGQGGQAGDGGGCDTSADPSTESCLVADDYAIFVDGTASTTGDGSKASPFKTIGEGLAAAKSAGKLVLVCDTNYDEQLNIDAGVRLYGGFKCTDWTYESGQKAVVKPAAKGYALEVSAVTNPVVIQDMEFDAQDGTDPGESSIAAFVHDSTGVAFDRVAFVAGKGVIGPKGTLANYTLPASADLNGGSVPSGQKASGSGTQHTCPAGDSSAGGPGGTGGGVDGQDGGDGAPALGGGAGGTKGGTCGTGAGQDGNAGSSGKSGASPALVGTVGASGWQGTPGPDGEPGKVGQGGGGGASNASYGGGGGAAGGCGGAGAKGGGAGGSSIAIVVLSSTTTLVDCTVSAASGGDGGAGTPGQSGMALGGSGGIPGGAGACSGGAGGSGGEGGASAGGAGGISVGIVYKGTQPTLTNTNVTTGAFGAKGIGGKPGVNDGIDGVNDETLQVQ